MVSGNGNGKLDAGETLDIIVEVNNMGHADSYNLTGFAFIIRKLYKF